MTFQMSRKTAAFLQNRAVNESRVLRNLLIVGVGFLIELVCHESSCAHDWNYETAKCERESRLDNVVKKKKTCKTSWRPRMCIGGVGVAPPQVVYQDTYLNICICHGGRGSSRGIGSRTGVPHGGCVINSPWLNLVSSNLGQKQKPDPLLVTPENRRIDLISQNPRLWQLSIEATKQIATPLRPQRHNQFGLSLFPVAAGL